MKVDDEFIEQTLDALGTHRRTLAALRERMTDRSHAQVVERLRRSTQRMEEAFAVLLPDVGRLMDLRLERAANQRFDDA